MQILKVTLKQHTPLLHFQPNEPNATLRASEVKPKLDKYIIEKVGGGPYETVKKSVKETHSGWFMDKKGIYSLSYKMSIEPIGSILSSDIEGYFGYRSSKNGSKPIPAPMFFGNMQSKDEPKGLFQQKGFSNSSDLSLVIICKNSELLDQIVRYIYNFFIDTNFGTRQSKGYGSFSIDNRAWEHFLASRGIYERPVISYPYFTTSGDLNTLFTEMEWFYKAIRSGINDCYGKDLFYMKSLMFAYAKEKGEQWEKKTIKSIFYDYLSEEDNFSEKVYKGEVQKHPRNNDNLTFTSANEGDYLFKDCLGLSTVEQWKKPYFDETGKLKYGDSFILSKESDSEENPIQRMKSPILLKPIRMANGNYRVYVIHSSIPDRFLGAGFYVGISDCEDEFLLNTFPKFSIEDYFDFLFRKNHGTGTYRVDIESLMSTGRDTAKAKRIKNIFAELRNTYN